MNKESFFCFLKILSFSVHAFGRPHSRSAKYNQTETRPQRKLLLVQHQQRAMNEWNILGNVRADINDFRL